MILLRRILVERRRVTIPLIVFLAGNFVVLLLVVLPMQRSVQGAEQARADAALSLTAARGLDLQAKAERTGKERADVELKRFYSEILPPDFQEAVRLASFWMGREARDSNLLFKTGQWDREEVRDSRLTKVSGQVTLSGDYADLVRFLHRIETADEFIVIEKVELSQSQSSQGTAPLEVALTVSTYYLTERPAGGASQ